MSTDTMNVLRHLHSRILVMRTENRAIMERRDKEMFEMQEQIEGILNGKRRLSDVNDNQSSAKKVKQETVTDNRFIFENGFVKVYTDGACSNNGKDDASAGYKFQLH